MFGPHSRYSGLELGTLEVKDNDGNATQVQYVLRRFIGRTQPSVLARHRVRDGDRLDNVTAAYYGDPTHFWRIADANRVLTPDELCELPGQTFDIPVPTG